MSRRLKKETVRRSPFCLFHQLRGRVGRGEGEVPLPDLRKRITKQKRALKPAEMTDVLSRLRALDAHRPPVGLPKGPVPTSMKGMRGQMRGR